MEDKLKILNKCIQLCKNHLKLEPVKELSEFQDGAKSAIKIIIMDLEQLKTKLSKSGRFFS